MARMDLVLLALRLLAERPAPGPRRLEARALGLPDLDGARGSDRDRDRSPAVRGTRGPSFPDRVQTLRDLTTTRVRLITAARPPPRRGTGPRARHAARPPCGPRARRR